MPLKASTQRALSMVLAASLVVGALIVYAVLVNPAYQEVQELRGKLASKSDLYQIRSQQFTQVQNLIAQYQGVALLQEGLSLALPQKVETENIINQLDAIAKNNRVFIDSISLDFLPIQQTKKRTLVKGFGTLRMSLKLLGPYSSFKGFLDSLETNIRIMDLRNLKISPAGEANEDFFSYSLTIDTYYQTNK